MAEKKKTTAKVAKEATEVKSIEQLEKDLEVKFIELVEAKKSHRLGELTNPRILRTKRREIARLKTAISQAKLTNHKEEK